MASFQRPSYFTLCFVMFTSYYNFRVIIFDGLTFYLVIRRHDIFRYEYNSKLWRICISVNNIIKTSICSTPPPAPCAGKRVWWWHECRLRWWYIFGRGWRWLHARATIFRLFYSPNKWHLHITHALFGHWKKMCRWLVKHKKVTNIWFYFVYSLILWLQLAAKRKFNL